MAEIPIDVAHERLRAAGWRIDLRTVRKSRAGFSRETYYAYTSPDGDVVFDRAQALERMVRAQRTAGTR
jgi:hypothetical protein